MENNRNISTENEFNLTVPYVVYRDVVTHHRWVVKRVVIAFTIILVAVIAAWFVRECMWLNAWNQYDFTSESIETTVDSEGDGIANFTGGDGGVVIGESNGEANEANAN